MISEEFQTLSEYEKNEFRRLCNTLLSHSYIVKEKYNASKDTTVLNEDYRLALKMFNIIKDYFYYIGWLVEKDEDYGFISIHSEYDNNRMKFDRFTTLFLYTLRLIFEEEREKCSNYRNIRTETPYVIEKMISLGLLKNGKSTISERIDAQRMLAHHNIIEKIEGKWENDGNHIIILPSILSIISNADINDMINELEEMKVVDNEDIYNSNENTSFEEESDE